MALKSLSSLPAWQEGKVLPQNRDVTEYYCPDRCGHNAACVKEELLIWGGYNVSNNFLFKNVGFSVKKFDTAMKTLIFH